MEVILAKPGIISVFKDGHGLALNKERPLLENQFILDGIF